MSIIVQTADDLAALQASDPATYRDQLHAILGSSRIRTNQAEYPEDYDGSLPANDEGYIEPQWVEIEDTATLQRLGFTDRAAVEHALQEAA